MNKLHFQRKIVLLLVSICFMSSIVGANIITKVVENSSTLYDEILFAIDTQWDEFLKNSLCSSDNQPPETPDVDGPTRGKSGVELTYTFVSTDPEGGEIIYCFNWGDNSGGFCIGPFASGEEATMSHMWDENGTYIITVNASDLLGAKSGTATLKVEIPRIRTLYNQLSHYLFKRFPIMERLLLKSYFNLWFI